MNFLREYFKAGNRSINKRERKENEFSRAKSSTIYKRLCPLVGVSHSDRGHHVRSIVNIFYVLCFLFLSHVDIDMGRNEKSPTLSFFVSIWCDRIRDEVSTLLMLKFRSGTKLIFCQFSHNPFLVILKVTYYKVDSYFLRKKNIFAILLKFESKSI